MPVNGNAHLMSLSNFSPAPFVLKAEALSDAGAIEALYDETFGPGRFVLAAYQVRAGVPCVDALSIVARDADRLVASIRFTCVQIGGQIGLLLGPLAVLPAFQRLGIGKALVGAGMARARALGYAYVLLVGDAPYYGAFGFTKIPLKTILMPRPVDPERLLIAMPGPTPKDPPAGPVIAIAPLAPDAID